MLYHRPGLHLKPVQEIKQIMTLSPTVDALQQLDWLLQQWTFSDEELRAAGIKEEVLRLWLRNLELMTECVH